MRDDKLDGELIVSLSLEEEERRKSPELSAGYSMREGTWELIIRYVGNLEDITTQYNITAYELLNQYAIVRIKEEQIEEFSFDERVILIEKPKELVFSEMEGIRVSCIPPVRRLPLSLQGEGCYVAIIDSGIDYTHPDFRNEDGTTRIVWYWDQDAKGGNPSMMGTIYSENEINNALQTANPIVQQQLLPGIDLSGHGTHVAGIAAGNGQGSNGRYVGVAPKAMLMIVKLAISRNGFPRTTELMMAIDAVVRYSLARRVPVAINLSIGNNYGDHRGNSLLETYIDSVADISPIVIAIGTGNDGVSGRYTQGRVTNRPIPIEITVAPFEASLSIQLWKEFPDEFAITIVSPAGKTLGPVTRENAVTKGVLGNTELAIYYGDSTPYNQRQELYISFLPQDNYIDSGIWTIEIAPVQISNGTYELWLPAAGRLSPATFFLQSEVANTITIPATASKGIGVGAYDSRTDAIANFSGRGANVAKPDLVAPGVMITSAAPGGGYTARSGTSMATPFVTGAAALLMEWGIVRGNDPFLYGEKLKAYLTRGARQLPGIERWPDPVAGWGALCVEASIPPFL